MTDEYDDHPALDGYPVDEDYVDVETPRRADVSTVEDDEREVEIDRSQTRPRADVSGLSMDMSHLFDSGEGSGAASEVDELIDGSAIVEHDGRAETRTFYYTAEVDADKRRKWTRMLRLQEGKGSGMKNAQRAADRRRYVSTFCGRLDMSQYQKERVQLVVDSVNMSHMAHYSSQKVILAAISLVANEDGWFIRDDNTFVTLMRDVGVTDREIRRIRRLLRQKSEVLD